MVEETANKEAIETLKQAVEKQGDIIGETRDIALSLQASQEHTFKSIDSSHDLILKALDANREYHQDADIRLEKKIKEVESVVDGVATEVANIKKERNKFKWFMGGALAMGAAVGKSATDILGAVFK
jgi:hypothetical protein